MIHALTPYPAMKDSGVPWLGQVPEHWALRRTKTVLRERSEKGFPDEPLLAATQTKGVVRKEDYESRTVLAMKDLHLLKLVKKNDFVISLRSFQGGLESAHYQGIISPAYTILYPVESKFHGYLASLFKSGPYIENLSLFVTGIRQGQNIDYEKLSRSTIPLPPPDEQAAIVRYLDHADRRIRRTIAAKQKLIKLLQEQKQVIIHQAVTRGLDPDVKLKPSGVEWLGDVPEGWEVRKMRSLFRFQGSGTTPSGDHYYGGDIAWVMSGDLNDGLVTSTKRSVTTAALREVSSLRLYPPETLLVAMYGATIGKTARLDIEACTNQACCAFYSALEDTSVKFVQLFLIAFKSHLIQQGYGGGQPNINADVVRSLRVSFPSRNEQDAIVNFVDQSLTTIDDTISRAQQEISFLREYRTRLIADVVTGKLDVRDAAALLPELEAEVLPDETEVDVDELDAEEVADEAVEA